MDHPLFDTLLYLGALIGFVGLLFQYIQGDSNATTKGWRMYLVGFLILFLAIKVQTDMAVFDPVTADTYVVVDAPLGLAVLGGTTSIVGSGFRNLFARYLSSPSGTDVLAKGGVGRGLAILQGMQGSPWTRRSKNPSYSMAGGAEIDATDLEYSIRNYMTDCYAEYVVVAGKGQEGFAIFYSSGAYGSVKNIWNRLKTPFVGSTKIKVRSADNQPQSMTCRLAHIKIESEIVTPLFSDALVDDMADHMVRQIAAVSLPGAGLAQTAGEGSPGQSPKDRIKTDARNIIKELFDGGNKDIANIVFLDRLNVMLLDALTLTPQFRQQAPEGRLAAAWNDARRQSDLSMAAQGDWFVRNAQPMTMVIEILVLAFIPIFAFAMFLGQQGMKGIMGSVGVLVWLQTWPIVYVIINHLTTHTVSAQFRPLLIGANDLGMLDLYMVFDQARHSYAVSQSMLGMTPLLTGMLLSGSVMMLTKVAGNISSNESVDESRIYRNTEGSAPIHQAQSASNIQLGKDGEVLYGDSTDSRIGNYNYKESMLAASTKTETMMTTEQQALGQTLLHAAADAVRTGDTEAYSKIIEKMQGITDKDQFSFGSEYSKSSEQEQKRIEATTASAAAEVSGSLSAGNQKALKRAQEMEANGGGGNKLLTQALGGNAGAQAKLGLTATDTTQFSESLKESKTWKEANATALESMEGTSVKEGVTIGSSLEGSLSDTHQDQVTTSEQKIKAFSDQLSNQRTAASGVSSDRQVGSGQVAMYMGELMREMENAARWQQNPDDQLDAMTTAAHKYGGLDKAQAGRLAGLLQNGAHHDQMKIFENNSVNMGWAGEDAKAYALFTAYDRTSRGQDDVHAGGALVGNLLHKNAMLIKPDLDIADPYTAKTEKVTNEAGVSGSLEEDVNTRLGGAPDVVPRSQLGLKDGKRAEEIKEEAKTAMARKAAFKQQQIQDQAEQFSLINAKDGDSTPTERLFGALQEFGLPEVAGFAGFDPETESDLASGRASDRAIKEAILKTALVGAHLEESRAGGASQEELQNDAVIFMGSLLRKDEQAQMSEDLADIDPGDTEAIREALAPYKQKLQERRLSTDPNEIMDLASRVSGDSIKGASVGDVVSDVGNAVMNVFRSEGQKGVAGHNDKMANHLYSMVKRYGGHEQGSHAVDDVEALSQFEKVLEASVDRRGGDLNLTDIKLAEIQAVGQYADTVGQYTGFRELMEEVQKSTIPGHEGGFSKVLGSLSGSVGNDGIALADRDFQKMADQFLGEDGYEKLRENLPEELKQRISSLNEEAIAPFIKNRNEKLHQ